ncbi:NUDIX domain-containing protein [Albibacterium indicum]|uniref:NUDIX domain-containing protein n=1 Tax=Albibacterium indicum TaxID=2292082 RepID=UPI000E4E6867|nr:NUDIX hydrolase [Pedobacter indicus]
MEFFNIRVYGILINGDGQILISDEIYHDQQFSKFPGGGLEFGESVIDCLKREFIEEFNLQLDSAKLMYITEEVIPSAFDKSQVIGIYYQVFTNKQLDFPIKSKVFDFEEGEIQALRWVPLGEFTTDMLTFEMDRIAWEKIRSKLQK